MRRIVAAMLTVLAVVMSACGSADSPAAPTAPTPPTVFRQGTLTIPQTFIADLDAGALVSNPLGPSDIWFEAVTATDRFLTSTGALLAVSGTTPPGFTGCSAANVMGSRIPVASLAAGLYLCGRTDESRIVEIRVVEPPAVYVPGEEVFPELKISFVTYNK
jgi:hypothetical protein